MARKDSEPQSKEVEGSVIAVRGNGENRFVVVKVTDEKLHSQLNSTVTFTLSDWQGETEPKSEQLVLLKGIEKFLRGWRAQSARPIALSDGH